MSKLPEEESLALIAIEANQTLENFVKPMYEMNAFAKAYAESFKQIQERINHLAIAPMIQMQESINLMFEPIRKMQESLNISAKLIGLISFTANTQLKENLSLFSKVGILPSKIIDADIEEEPLETRALLPAQNISQFQLAPSQSVRLNTRKSFLSGADYAFDITITVEGRFGLKGRILKSLSTSSKHGKFLELLLKNPDNYISDSDAISKLDVIDEDKGLGYIRNDLKESLTENGLQINLYRQRKTGYRLLGIKKISN